MLTWKIEYFYGALPLHAVEGSTLRAWRDAPAEGVVFVRLYYSDGKPRVLRLVGSDHYFLRPLESSNRRLGWVTGGWTDPHQPWASPHRAGTRYVILDGGHVTAEPLAPPPQHFEPSIVKHGVMVPEPFAEQLGLTGGESPPPAKGGCCG